MDTLDGLLVTLKVAVHLVVTFATLGFFMWACSTLWRKFRAKPAEAEIPTLTEEVHTASRSPWARPLT